MYKSKLGVYVDSKFNCWIESTAIAAVLEKPHQSVLDRIKSVKSKGFSDEFLENAFVKCKDGIYAVSRDGVVVLSLDNVALILEEFNETEDYAQYLSYANDMNPRLRAAIEAEYDPHYVAEELDLILEAITGKTVGQYRKERKIPKDQSIKTYLNKGDAFLFEYLQFYDIGFVIAVTDYVQRKQLLHYQVLKWRDKHNENISETV